MIYLLEDDDSIRELVVYSLSKTGYPTKGFARPSAFFAAVSEELPELCLLDVMLPEQDGLSVLAALRQDPTTAGIPVIMLTAKGGEFDKVVALDGGADDYVTKPFGVMELCARVRALLRRTLTPAPEGAADVPLSVAELCLSVARHTVTVSGESVVLTYKEFELLRCLLENRGRVLGRDRLLSEIWGYSFDGESRTVDVHVRSLRAKLGTAGRLIETVRGFGYRLGDEA